MPIKKGHSPEIVKGNIDELLKAGHKLKQAQAIAISSAYKSKKMAMGGMVEEMEEDGDYRDLAQIALEGDQGPVASPDQEKRAKSLAEALNAKAEDMEYMSDGGLVEGMDGDAEPEPKEDGGTEAPLSDEVKAAIMLKKQKRKY